MTEPDAAALFAFTERLLGGDNNKADVEFRFTLKAENGSYFIEVWNGRDQFTDKLTTVAEWVNFFSTKFMLGPTMCYHLDYRNPKDPSGRSFVCTRCERLSYHIELHDSLGFGGDIATTEQP